MKLSDELKSFVRKNENADVHTLILQANKNTAVDMEVAIRQIAGRQIAKIKLPNWYACEDLLYPKHISLEQCSSAPTASYKASLVHGDRFVDLTGGLGVDFSFMAKQFTTASYVEQQAELVELAKHNFDVLGLNNVNSIYSTAETYLQEMPAVDVIYLDPARRDGYGRKTVSIEDCTPNLYEIEDLLEAKAQSVLIKLSPMLDITKAINTLRHISDVYIISHKNECKELLFFKQKKEGQTQIHCINLIGEKIDQFKFSYEEERNIELNYSEELGNFLYEPNSSIIKAGAYKSVAKHYAINKLHPSSHLYTSNELIADFQGRKFEIVDSCSLNKKELKISLDKIDKANITTRNFPLSVDELRKKIKVQDGGDIYIFATTLANNQKSLIICKKR